ncbi:MAG: hypothetical protein KDD36_09350 [Flavobacteriales bacterium]|nr:hypothetical protein [Flavobacteriales bacterium]
MSVPVSVVVDTLPEDFNGDGVVSNIDFLIFLGKFGSACTCLEDLNHDGFVTNVDFLTFLGKFGSSCN